MNEAVKGRSPLVTPAIGDVRLLARDAQVHGTKLRYEPEPFKNTLGYWTEAADSAEWTFDAPEAGRYEVEVHQGCGGNNGGSEVEVRARRADAPLHRPGNRTLPAVHPAHDR